MQRLFCKHITVSGTHKNGSRGSIFLHPIGTAVEREVITLAQNLVPGKIASKNMEEQNIQIYVWKSFQEKSIGSVSGTVCSAKIIHDQHNTYIDFILAEKSVGGHNSADLRLPLFD